MPAGKKKVLIVECSKVITERLITIIEDLDEVEDILYASGFCKVPNLLVSEKIDIVVWCVPFTDEIINTLSEVSKSIQPPLFIVLSAYTDRHYKKRFPGICADFFLDKANDFDKIPGIVINTKKSCKEKNGDKTFKQALN